MKIKTTGSSVRVFILTLLMVALGVELEPVLAEAAQKSVEQVKKEAANLLQNGNYEEACNVLDAIQKDEYDPQLTFLRGQCRFGMLDYSAAVFQYQLMLERNTNLPRVRTELGRTLAAMGKSSAAKEEYEKVLSGDIPAKARENINLQMQRLDERRRWGGVFSLGFMHDSNVNGAPSNPNIKAFGLPFTLDADSTDTSDNALMGSVSFGKYFDGPVADEWRYDVYGNLLDYFSEHNFDSYSIGLSMGPNFYSNAQLYLPFGANISWEDGHRASQSASFSPSLSKAINHRLRANGQLSFQYSDDLRSSDESNGWSKGINVNFQYTVSQMNMVELGLSVQDNDANDIDYNRFISKAINAGWHTAFQNGVKLSFQPSYAIVEYDSSDPVDSGSVRDDDRYSANINIYKNVIIRSTAITPVLALTWTKNDSNIDRRDYERKQISLQFRMQF